MRLTDSSKLNLTLVLVLGASLSAFSYPFISHYCADCTRVDRLLFPNLYLFGGIYYLVAAAALYRFKINQWTLVTLYVPAGIHSVLMAKLLHSHLMCWSCVATATCIMMALFVAVDRTVRVAAASALAGMLLCIGTFLVYQRVTRTNEDQSTKLAIRFDSLNLSDKDRLPIFVFEDPTCSKCLEFNDLYVPRLKMKYASKIDIHIERAPAAISVPTVVLGGDSPVLMIHKPDWFDLTSAVEKRIQKFQ